MMKIRENIKLNYNKNIMNQNLWNIGNSIIWGKFTSLNANSRGKDDYNYLSYSSQAKRSKIKEAKIKRNTEYNIYN